MNPPTSLSTGRLAAAAPRADCQPVDRTHPSEAPLGLSRNIPFLALHLACAGVLWVGFSWTALAVAAALYALRMFAITGFYHRYFSHKTFRASRPVQFLMGLAGTLAVQKGPLWWAAHHRYHHAHSDHEDDVHSPRRHGLFRSHVGWFLTEPAEPVRRRLAGSSARRRLPAAGAGLGPPGAPVYAAPFLPVAISSSPESCMRRLMPRALPALALLLLCSTPSFAAKVGKKSLIGTWDADPRELIEASGALDEMPPGFDPTPFLDQLGMTLTLAEDGTGMFEHKTPMGGGVEHFTWEITEVEENRITVRSVSTDEGEDAGEEHTVKIEVADENTLLLTHPEGPPMKLTRAGTAKAKEKAADAGSE